MYRVLIWGVGYHYNQYINAMKYCEMSGEIEIVGVTDRNMLYTCLDGYPFFSLHNLETLNVDYIAVTSEKNYDEISKQAELLGFSKSMLIMAKVFLIPGFRFGRYIELLQSKISIIANNCWGGYMYHALGMKFYSPFINMFLSDDDYLELVNHLQYYLVENELKFERFGYQPGLNIEYPICKLEDIELHFNHYTSMEEVEEQWYKRVRRLNWNNLFIMMFTNRQDSLKAFEHIGYQKKICFVPFDSQCSLQSEFDIRIARCEAMLNTPLYKIINGIPKGEYHDYDLVELLLKGRVNHDRYYIR